MSQDLNKSSRALVLDLINAANESTFAEGDFTWGVPMAVSRRPDGRNTILQLSNIPASNGMVGSQSIAYNRLDFSQLFNGVELIFEDSVSLETTADILPLLNTQQNLSLEEDDIVVEPLIRNGDAPYTCVLKASVNSYAYIGKVSFQLSGEPVAPTGPYATNGFFFVNMTDGKIGTSIGSLTDVEDPELPLATTTFDEYPAPMAMASGGYQNEIFAIVTVPGVIQDTYDLELHFSTDGGLTWDKQPLLANASLDNYVNATCLFFKGCFYFGADVASSYYKAAVVRVVPDTEGAYPYKAEIALNLNYFYGMAASADYLYVVDGASDGIVHITANGVDWTPESTLMYPDYGICETEGVIYTTGYDSEGVLSVQKRALDGTYSIHPFGPIEGRVFEYFDYNSMFAIDNTLFIVATTNSTLDSVSAYLSGDVFKSTDQAATWTLQHSDTGIRLPGAIADDGTIAYAVGLVDGNGDTGGYTNRMMATTDRGATWTFYDATSFPFLVDTSVTTMAVVRRILNGEAPTLVAMPAPLPNLVTDYPESATIEARSLTVAPDDRILVSGGTSFTALTQINNETITTNLGLLDADGVVVDTSGMGLTNVFNSVFDGDGKILVAGGGSGYDNNLLRFNNDLTPDTTFNPPPIVLGLNFNYPKIQDILVQSDGKIIISGCFESVNGVTSHHVARFNADGTHDSTFTSPITARAGSWGSQPRVFLLKSGRILTCDPNSGDLLLSDATGALIRTLTGTQIYAACELSNGDIWLSAKSPSNPLLTSMYVYKWLNDGTLVTDTPASALMSTLLFDLGSDQVLMHDNVTVGNGQPQPMYIVEADGTFADAGFRAKFNRAFTKLAQQSTGAYVGLSNLPGDFLQEPYPRFNAKSRNYIARFYANTEDLPTG